MFNANDRIYEEVRKEEAINSIFKRVEQAEGSKIKRLVRSAQHEGKFHFTMILENYKLVEITLGASSIKMMGATTIEVDVEVY